MAEREGKGGLSDALRQAVERTYDATAGPASDTRERAQELLDELVRRGERAQQLVDELVRRGERARERVSDVVSQVKVPNREGLAKAGREELGKLEDELASIGRRLEELEAALRRRRR